MINNIHLGGGGVEELWNQEGQMSFVTLKFSFKISYALIHVILILLSS